MRVWFGPLESARSSERAGKLGTSGRGGGRAGARHDHGLKNNPYEEVSVLKHTRQHNRRVPGVPGSAKRWALNRGRDML